jgi:hypothetical protein
MEPQDGAGGFNANGYGDAMSSLESSKPKLQLPVSCDPPGPSNPAKQMVWIVSLHPPCEVSILPGMACYQILRAVLVMYIYTEQARIFAHSNSAL